MISLRRNYSLALSFLRSKESVRRCWHGLAGVKKHRLLLVILALALYNAQSNYFIQDDAYISFNYAKWFARGEGLVWYPGSSEFGLTNFFYSLMIGLCMALAIPPEASSAIINMASFMGSLVLVYAIAIRFLASRLRALLPVLLLATHHSFTSYASGGLETMWVTFLLLLFYWHILTRQERRPPQQYVRLGVLSAVLLLSRLDSLLLLAAGYVFMFMESRDTRLRALVQRAIQLRYALVIPAFTLLLFLLGCIIAYGHALPNSFALKVPADASMIYLGLRYLWLYIMVQGYVPLAVPLLLLYFVRRGCLRKIRGVALAMAATVAIWLCYIVFVGGDFMEFRFLVPVLPLYYLVIFRAIATMLPRRRTWAMLGVTLAFLVANALHPALFSSRPNVWDLTRGPKPVNYAFVEDTGALGDWMTHERVNWRDIGRGLNALFADTDVKLATTAIGAITYFSDLNTIDLLGLNTRAVNDHHNDFMPRPGHRIIANDALLQELAVNLNLSHPQTVCKAGGGYAFTPMHSGGFGFERHETLFLPLGNGCYAVADYLRPHPAIEELLAKKVIIRFRDVKRQTNCPAWLCVR